MMIPKPQYIEPEPPEVKSVEWYRWFLGCPDWVCSKCRNTNFGRNKCCARCKDPRPPEYIEDTFNPTQT